jgi:hypothetical protein
MHRYWIKFKTVPGRTYHPAVVNGCGVTAFYTEDALEIARQAVFACGELPEVDEVIEDIDIAMLDRRRVVPNMRLPFRRGVWFPEGYRLRVT